MRLGQSRVCEKRLSRLHLAIHERDRATGDLCVDQSPLLEIVHLHLTTLLALAPLHDLFGWNDARRVARRRRPERFVGRTGNAVPFVESLIVGEAPVLTAQMPLAEEGGRIACRRE